MACAAGDGQGVLPLRRAAEDWERCGNAAASTARSRNTVRERPCSASVMCEKSSPASAARLPRSRWRVMTAAHCVTLFSTCAVSGKISSPLAAAGGAVAHAGASVQAVSGPCSIAESATSCRAAQARSSGRSRAMPPVTRSREVQVHHGLSCAGGRIEGDVRLNGHPKVAETFARVSGYVEQTGAAPG